MRSFRDADKFGNECNIARTQIHWANGNGAKQQCGLNKLCSWQYGKTLIANNIIERSIITG